MVYGLRAKQKKPKRGGSVSMFLSNLPKFPHGRPDSDFFFFLKDGAVDSFRRAARGGMKREQL